MTQQAEHARPHRVQLSRMRGWRMPENTVSVARPGKWGNPFRIGDFPISNACAAVSIFKGWTQGRIVGPPLPDFRLLRGKNLACWCKPGDSCHADVILEIANAD